MSIRQIFREFVAAKRKAQSERERDITSAWNTAALTGAAWGGKMPDLPKLLEKSRPQLPQDVSTMRVMAETVANTIGLKMTKRKPTDRVIYGR
jgi:hypothetical protein